MPELLNPKEWVKKYSDLLFRFAILRVNDRETAKDLVQETYLAAYRNIDSFKGEISEKNWLFLILKNKIIDYYRKKSNEILTELDECENALEDYFDDKGHWKSQMVPTGWNADYNNALESKEFFDILNKCLQRLSELSRIVFTLKYLDEKESDEICKELTITSSNYWVVIHRAKLQLRACIEKNWFVK
ncbi:MAG: sigma-70 family RNA polymerase sigma factor [Bacteroidota bacterium]